MIYSRVDLDWYVEPVSATERLLAVERPFVGLLCDPCCGQGNVVKALEAGASCPVVGSDLVARDSRFQLGDFRETMPKIQPISVVTNPPYKHAKDVAHHALQNTQDRVCLFLRLAFLEGKERSQWLENTPLARVWIFADRVSCTPGHLLGEKQKNNGTTAYAWFVWEHGYHGKPTIGHLHPPHSQRVNQC